MRIRMPNSRIGRNYDWQIVEDSPFVTTASLNLSFQTKTRSLILLFQATFLVTLEWPAIPKVGQSFDHEETSRISVKNVKDACIAYTVTLQHDLAVTLIDR